MSNNNICKIDGTNQFWLNYLSLERELLEINDYISFHKDNFNTFSYKVMKLYLVICSEVDSIYKEIRKNLEKYTIIKKIDDNEYPNIKHHKSMIENCFPKIKNSIVELNIDNNSLEFKPIKVLFDSEKKRKENIDNDKKLGVFRKDKYYGLGWWDDYNAVKHNRVERLNKANLKNLLTSMSALHMLNLLLGISADKSHINNYYNIIVEASTAHYQFPIFKLKNFNSSRYIRSIGSNYVCRLDNKKIS